MNKFKALLTRTVTTGRHQSLSKQVSAFRRKTSAGSGHWAPQRRQLRCHLLTTSRFICRLFKRALSKPEGDLNAGFMAVKLLWASLPWQSARRYATAGGGWV